MSTLVRAIRGPIPHCSLECRRRSPESRYEIDALVRATATTYPDPMLRTLEAIHLATAQAIFGTRLQTFVTSDERLGGAARDCWLTVTAPR